MKIRGQGGWWVVYAPPEELPDGTSGDADGDGVADYLVGAAADILKSLSKGGKSLGLVQHNAAYQVDLVEELKQSRTPNGGGWTEALPVVRRVEGATFRVCDDDVGFPEAVGFVEGTELTVYLKVGELDAYDRITRTIVESVHRDNDQTKARWVEINCKHGRYERQVSNPPLPEEP